MERIILKFLASFLIWFLYAGLIILWFVDGKIKKEQVAHALVASLITWLLVEVLKSLFDTDRPFMVNGGQALTLTIPKDGAFPSNHTALAFSLATTIWLHDRRVGWLFLIFAIIIGIARVLANVHYPSDILGGATLGILTAFTVEKIHFRKLFRK